ncbi:MAG: anti-anti-sigma factor [unclassified Hahellaceae]|nr:anti-anti-sigma factor [Hahellaceae bacterium]
MVVNPGFKILQAEKRGVYVIKFVGEIRLNLCSTLDRVIERMQADEGFVTVIVDLTETTVVDSTTLGLIAKIGLFARERDRILPTIISVNADVTRLIMTMGLDDLFVIVSKAAAHASDLLEIPILQASEDEVRQKVLAAHLTLMEINDANKETFRDLVAALECDQAENESRWATLGRHGS